MSEKKSLPKWAMWMVVAASILFIFLIARKTFLYYKAKKMIKDNKTLSDQAETVANATGESKEKIINRAAARIAINQN